MTGELRKAALALGAMLVLQTVSGLIWAGGAAARIATLEAQVGEQRLVAERLARHKVEIRADQRALAFLPEATAATDDDWSAEYLGPTVSVAIVDSVEQAAAHINQYGSHHTDAIITENLLSANAFTTLVDSSAVMVNASTRFNDGGVFGLGAEIGISTDKFHARGPCGLRELTTYKYIVQGSGQIRE